MSLHVEPDSILERIRYLCFFQRSFQLIRNGGQERDRDRMLLGGWLADALHNLPDALRRYPSESGQLSGVRLGAFSEHIGALGAPSAIIEEAQRVLCLDATPEVLGMRGDLSDYEPPPLPWEELLLSLLLEGCLMLRGARNFGFPPHDAQYPGGFWITSNATWAPEGDLYGERNGLLAAALTPLPAALVRWSAFDEDGAWVVMERTAETLKFSPQCLETWRGLRAR